MFTARYGLDLEYNFGSSLLLREQLFSSERLCALCPAILSAILSLMLSLIIFGDAPQCALFYVTCSYAIYILLIALWSDTEGKTDQYFIHPAVLRQVHSPFQSEFAIDCNLVLPLSIASILPFHQCHPVTAYVFFPVLPSLHNLKPGSVKECMIADDCHIAPLWATHNIMTVLHAWMECIVRCAGAHSMNFDEIWFWWIYAKPSQLYFFCSEDSTFMGC